MLAQDIFNECISTPVQASAQQSYLPAVSWKTLPIAQLHNFESVNRQFAPFGVRFDDTIALYPSNPRFSLPNCPIVLMPKGRCKGCKIHLQDAVSAIDLGLIGSKQITISALDDKGYCVAVAQTEAISPVAVKQVYPEQFVRLQAGNAKTLRLEAKAPFVMTHFSFETTTRSI
ncbi:MAG: hypothetical protein AAFX01_05200 [Cyanobacteria bacterium J06638_28]